MITRAIKEGLDERYLTHRLRASSLAGVVGGIAASLLFVYRFFRDGVTSWDLLGIAVTIAVVKLAALAYYRATD